MPLTAEQAIDAIRRLDMTAALKGITDDEVLDLKAGIGAMLDGKVAALRDNDIDRATEHTAVAKRHLMALGVGGAVLFGDLAKGIEGARTNVLAAAMVAQHEGEASRG